MTTYITANEIKVDAYFGGPIGGYGFRSGMWACEYRGSKFRVFASVPHACEIKEQEARVREIAAHYLERNNRRAAIAEMIDDGMSLRAIGQALGISKQRVHQINHAQRGAKAARAVR